MTEQEWDEVKAHFDEIRKQYDGLDGLPGVNVSIALWVIFEPYNRRYNRGERTQELYDAMKGVA